MKLFAKCICNQDQYNDRVSKPHDGIELQLLNTDTYKTIEQFLTDEVDVVHSPLALGVAHNKTRGLHPDYPVDFPNTWKTHDYFINIVHSIATKQQRTIKYVMHIEQAYDIINWDGTIFDLVHYLRQKADQNPNIIFCLENTTYSFTEPVTHQLIAQDVNRSNVGTCLDICHAQEVVYAVSAIKGTDEHVSGFPDVCSLENFFAMNRHHCKLIHLNQAVDVGTGYGRGKGHGYPFDGGKKDITLIKMILGFYNTYEYKCPITIEVREDNHTDAKNYLMTYDAVQKVL